MCVLCFLNFANGGSFTSFYLCLVCEDKATYCFSIQNSFNHLQASITQIGKNMWGLCLIIHVPLVDHRHISFMMLKAGLM